MVISIWSSISGLIIYWLLGVFLFAEGLLPGSVLVAAEGSVANKFTNRVPFLATKLDTTMYAVDAQMKPLPGIPVNKLTRFKVQCTSCKPHESKDLALLKFDALMEGHGHGMVTKAKISQTGPGEYLIEGLKFHMPGAWKINMKWQLGQEVVEVAMPLNL